jgi:hypothetical protein
MLIIGCDYHPGFQQIAYVDTETGELRERRLEHPEEAEKFYRELAAQGMKVRIGMEASGHARWFERLLAELNFAYRAIERHARRRLRQWLCAKHKLRWPATKRYPEAALHQKLGLVQLSTRTTSSPWATS